MKNNLDDIYQLNKSNKKLNKAERVTIRYRVVIEESKKCISEGQIKKFVSEFVKNKKLQINELQLMFSFETRENYIIIFSRTNYSYPNI